MDKPWITHGQSHGPKIINGLSRMANHAWIIHGRSNELSAIAMCIPMDIPLIIWSLMVIYGCTMAIIQRYMALVLNMVIYGNIMAIYDNIMLYMVVL